MKLSERLRKIMEEGMGEHNGDHGPYLTYNNMPGWERELLDLFKGIIEHIEKED